mgnify:FL=1
MAQKLFSSSEVTNAQVAYQQGIYTLFQNKTDMWGQIKKLPKDMVNATGIQVSFLRFANPSLSYGTGNNDAYATAGAGDYDNFTVGYVNLNAGNIQTVGGVLNANKNTVENMLDREIQESAQQFASFLNSYVSRGDSTMALATISANYSGGTPTIATCDGSTDSIGTTQLATGGYYLFYNAAGTTQRTGTVGASAIQLSSRTGTACTFATDIPSDVVATDIIVPQIGGSTDASTGLYGLPIIDDSAGTYFGKARATYGGLASYEKTSAGTLTAGMMNETYWAIVQRGGYFTGAGASNLDDKLWTVMNSGNAQNYQSLSLNSGALVSSPQTFMHTKDRPANDIGFATHDMTWYGSPLWIANSVRGDEIYYLGKDSLRRAILKDVGDVDGRFPAGDYLQNMNGDGAYLQARVKVLDFFGQVYAPEPFKIGKISGLTLVAPTQKATMNVT